VRAQSEYLHLPIRLSVPTSGRPLSFASLSVSSGFRSDAEQAVLFAANPNPKWVAPPGTSLHRYAIELDLARPPPTPGWPPTTAASASSSGIDGNLGTTTWR
jgi:hypothetical protein